MRGMPPSRRRRLARGPPVYRRSFLRMSATGRLWHDSDTRTIQSPARSSCSARLGTSRQAPSPTRPKNARPFRALSRPASGARAQRTAGAGFLFRPGNPTCAAVVRPGRQRAGLDPGRMGDSAQTKRRIQHKANCKHFCGFSSSVSPTRPRSRSGNQGTPILRERRDSVQAARLQRRALERSRPETAGLVAG